MYVKESRINIYSQMTHCSCPLKIKMFNRMSYTTRCFLQLNVSTHKGDVNEKKTLKYSLYNCFKWLFVGSLCPATNFLEFLFRFSFSLIFIQCEIVRWLARNWTHKQLFKSDKKILDVSCQVQNYVEKWCAIVTKRSINILYAANEIVVFRITDKRQKILACANINTDSAWLFAYIQLIP